MKSFELKEGMFKDIPSDVYHGTAGSYSSTQLKDAASDIAIFHGKYISKTIEKESGDNPAFKVGTYYHTAILEPDKLNMDCVKYEGVRRGEKWDKFLRDNEGRTIVSEGELKQAETLIAATKNSPIAMNRIARSEPEVSAFVQIRIVGTDIYAPSFDKILTKYGWSDHKSIPKKGVDLWIKVRADALGSDFILDLKSTSGNAKDSHSIKSKISSLNYDLSASLYLDVFSLVTKRTMTDFIWTFASKDYGNCKNYMASHKNIMVGRAKYRKALLNIAEGIESNWVIPDSMEILEPAHWDLEYLTESGEELL